jgi:hypothetical protein
MFRRFGLKETNGGEASSREPTNGANCHRNCVCGTSFVSESRQVDLKKPVFLDDARESTPLCDMDAMTDYTKSIWRRER